MIHAFYKIFSMGILILLLNVACKKSIGEKPVNYIHLKVLELKTGIPLEGALVKLYACNHPDVFGCLSDSLVDVETTDKDGDFQFDANLNAYTLTASEKNYIDASGGGIGTGFGDIYLMPLAHTKIHLVKQNPHPDSLLLAIASDIDPAPLWTFPETNYYHQANDTTVLIASCGNINNTINWYFTDNGHVVITTETGGHIPDYYINRFDTAIVELHY